MSNIDITVAGREIKVAPGYEKPSAGDVETCSVSITIVGDEWEALPLKRVTFSSRGGSITVPFSSELQIPWEVLRKPGALYVTVTGWNADGIEVMRTHRMTYPLEIAKAGDDMGNEPGDPTPDVLSQVLTLAADLEQKRDSDYWKGEKGEPGKDADIASADQATDAANSAAVRADSAASYANAQAAEIKRKADSGEFDGADGKTPVKGVDYFDGEPGFSPVASVERTENGAVITVIDRNGTTTATVSDGAPGEVTSAHLTEATKDIAPMKTRIDNLEAAIRGIEYREVTESNNAYEIAVPSGTMKWGAVNEIGGNTVVWNQLVQNGDFADGTTRWSNGGCTISATGGVLKMDIAGATYAYVQVPVKIETGHKYFIKATIKNEVQDSTAFAAMYAVDTIINGDVRIKAADGWKDYYAIKSCASAPADVNKLFRVVCSNSAAMSGSVYAKNCYAIDLTAMFGAGNEPSTVAEFRSMFPADYYPYDAGSLLSAEVTAVESRGKNLLFAPTIENTIVGINSNPGDARAVNKVYVGMSVDGYVRGENITDFGFAGGNVSFKTASGAYGIGYTMSAENLKGKSLVISHASAGGSVRVTYYGASWNVIGYSQTIPYGSAFSIPNDAEYIAVILFARATNVLYTTEKVQLELGTTDTAYAPYRGVIDTLPIPQAVRDMCPAYGASVGELRNEIDLERKKYVQRVGIVDLGTLTWAYVNTSFRASIDGMKGTDNYSSLINALCGIYSPVSYGAALDTTGIMSYHLSEKRLVLVNKNYTSSIDFKAAMAGVMLNYELATPVEVDLSEALGGNNIEVEAGGTLTFKQPSAKLPVPSKAEYVIKVSDAI